MKMKGRWGILLSVLLVLSVFIPVSKANSDLNVQWIWEKELYQQDNNNVIIRVRNDNVLPVVLKSILIHYAWDAENSFNILYLNETVQPTKEINIKFPVFIPYNMKTGETSDFACILDYSIGNSTEILGTDIVRSTQTIRSGSSIYVSQSINPAIIYAISIFFIVLCIALYSSKETLISLLVKHKRFIPHVLFVLTFSVYVTTLYMNFYPYQLYISDFRGFSITGDEPHYIYATKGLLQGTTDPMLFYPVNYGRHVVLSDGLLTRGQVVFAHMYGLPVMSMIPYKLGETFLSSGTGGCLLFICLIVSLIIQLIYKSSMFLSKDNIITSVITSLTFAFSTLLFVWSGQFFADIVMAFFIMLFVTCILISTSTRSWIVAGISLGVLPFFKYQFILFVPFCIILAVVLLKNRKGELKTFLISYISTTFVNLFYMYLFVGLTSITLLGTYTYFEGVRAFNLFGLQIHKLFYVTWLGLLLDRNVGVLFYSPILILSVLGVFQLLRTKNVAIYFATLICVFWVGTVSASTNWNGWIAPPARYMIVILPLFSLPFIMGVTSFYRNRKYMYSFVFLFLCGLIPNTLMATNRLLDYVMYSDYGGGINRFMEALMKLKINIAVFPEFFDNMWTGQNIIYVYIWSIGFICVTVMLLYFSFNFKLDVEEMSCGEVLSERNEEDNSGVD